MIKKINNITKTHPEFFNGENLKVQWNYEKNNKLGLYPEEYTYGSNKKVWWIDEKNHEWEVMINKIILGRSCPFCNKSKVLIGFNDLKTTSLEFFDNSNTIQWDYQKNQKLKLYPENFIKGSHQKVYWNCGKHNWISSISNVIAHKKGCPYCSRKSPIIGETDLKTIYPEIAKEWNYERNNNQKPENFLPGSNKKVFWICSQCNYEWKTSIANRTFGHTGCPSCNQSKGELAILQILKEYNLSYRQQFIITECKNILYLKFDFAIFDYNKNLKLLIEFQGVQHYKPTDFAGKGKDWAEKQFEENKLRDQIKRNYCKNSNIPLLEIPYTEFDNIEQILKIKLKELGLI